MLLLSPRSFSSVFAFLLFMLLGGGPLLSLEPQRSISQYGHDRWDLRNGLPGSAVDRLYQLSDGYLWLLSEGKLFRFDGVRFSPILLDVKGQTVDEAIRAVALDSAHRLLVRTRTRILRLDQGHFSDAAPPVSLPDGMDTAICQTRDGAFWIGSDNHLFRLWEGRLGMVVQGAGKVYSILEDRSGALWIAASSAFYRYRDHRLTKFPPGYQWANVEIKVPLEPPTPAEAAVKLPKVVTTALEDKRGTLWIGTFSGLWKLRNGVLQEDAETAGLKGCYISDLLEDRDGNIWAGTAGKGLFRLAQGKWSHFSLSDGLSDDSILSLHEDREGSLWIGTRLGLDRLRDTPLLTITSRDGLSGDNTDAVQESRNGSLYVFAIGNGLTRVKDGNCTVFTTRNGLADNSAGTFYEGRDGAFWVGTAHGLSCFRDGELRTFMAGGRLSSLGISSICEDDESLILSCFDLNLYRFKNDRLSPYDLKLSPGTGSESVRFVFQMLRDEDGTLWFAMTAGLYRLGRHEPPEKAVRTAFRDLATSIYDDGRGYLWILGRDLSGFTRLCKRDGSLVRFAPEIGVPKEKITTILSDSAGNLWMATRDGIIRFDRAGLDAYALGRATSVAFRRFGAIDGLQTVDCGGTSAQPSGWRGKDGRLYFVSRKGLVVIQADNLQRNGLWPPVHIEDLVVDKVVQPARSSLTIPPGCENLEIRYTALSLAVPSRVSFKYRLEGYDSEWIDAGNRRTAYYTHLPPGTYRFRVIACNNDGLWNEEGDALSFTLQPHFYQTQWFIAACITGGLAAIWGLYLLRIFQMRRRQSELEQLVQARTEELRNEVAERTEVQQALNNYLKNALAFQQRFLGDAAHELRTPLAVVGTQAHVLSSARNEDERAQAHDELVQGLGRASSLVSQLLTVARLESDNFVANLVEVELESRLRDWIADMVEKAMARNIEISLDSPGKTVVHTDPNCLRHAFDNLIENAIRYGNSGGHIVVFLAMDEDGFRIRVADDGPGIPAAERSKIFDRFYRVPGTQATGSGLGLAIVKRSVESLGGSVTISGGLNGRGISFEMFLPQEKK